MSELKRQMQICTNGLWKDVHHTTAAEWPPELVRFAEPMRPEMPDPKNTFADHSYPAYSRAQMVQAMLDAVELYRRTQPEATKPAQDLSAAIDWLRNNYQDHANIASLCDAMCAALASPADALVAGDRVDAKRTGTLYQAVQRAAGELPEGWTICLEIERDAGTVELIDPEGNRNLIDGNDGYLCQAVNEAIDAAIQAQKDGHG